MRGSTVDGLQDVHTLSLLISLACVCVCLGEADRHAGAGLTQRSATGRAAMCSAAGHHGRGLHKPHTKSPRRRCLDESGPQATSLLRCFSFILFHLTISSGNGDVQFCRKQIGLCIAQEQLNSFLEHLIDRKKFLVGHYLVLLKVM